MSTMETDTSGLEDAKAALQIALPAPGDQLDQDEEWVLVKLEEGWRQIRLHDYNEVYEVQGLYEKWVYDVLECASPQKIRDLLGAALKEADIDPASLTVLDLGAGNGCVAEVLTELGMGRFVGIDIYREAAEAAERDRPGLYDAYFVGDLTLPETSRAPELARDFEVLTCVAALGFSDIPPAVFAAAYNQVSDDGWVAFTIKADFMNGNDTTGFSGLITSMLRDGVLELVSRDKYQHRASTEGEPLLYEAFVGRKRRDVPQALVDSAGV